MTSLIEQAAAPATAAPAVAPQVATAVSPAVAPTVAPTVAPVAAPAVIRAPGDVHSKRVDLDLEALAAQGFLTPNAPRTVMADQYRNN